MAITIVTRYLSPTNTKGARVSASFDGKRVTVAWDHALGTIANHAAAAQKLAEKIVLGSASFWFAGEYGNDYLWSNVDPNNRSFTVDKTGNQ